MCVCEIAYVRLPASSAHLCACVFLGGILLASVDLPLSCMSPALQRHALHIWKPKNEMSTAEVMTYLQTLPFLDFEITTT